MKPSVWACLPTYNERDNIERMLDALLSEFDRHDIDGHVLVIDDGSPDGTGQLADAVAARDARVAVLHRTEKGGLGRAYIAGFREVLARGADLVIEIDCDFSHNPSDVHRLVAAAERADVVLGSRYVTGGGVEGWPASRMFISKGGSAYARTILRLSVRDLTGGFKCMRRSVLETIDLDRIDAKGYAFQIELTYRAVRAGFSLTEVPIVFTDRVEGESKMGFSIVLEALWRVWAMRFARH